MQVIDMQGVFALAMPAVVAVEIQHFTETTFTDRESREGWYSREKYVIKQSPGALATGVEDEEWWHRVQPGTRLYNEWGRLIGSQSDTVQLSNVRCRMVSRTEEGKWEQYSRGSDVDMRWLYRGRGLVA